MPNLLPPSRRVSERAHSFDLYLCGNCPHLHIALKDANDDIYADFVLSRRQVMTLHSRGMSLLDEAVARNLRSQQED